MARLYADENFPLPAVEKLQRLGHDVQTCQDAGHAGQAMTDVAVLDHARKGQRAVLTLNRLHFIRLHRAKQDHAGIVVCSSDSDFDGLARRIHEEIEGVGLLAGKLLRINRPG